MYSIARVIYGVPLTGKVVDIIEDGAEDYFTMLYSGSADYTPGFIGIVLGEINECHGANKLDLEKGTLTEGIDGKNKTFSIVPSEKQKEEVKSMIEKLPQELKNIIEPIDVYFIWCTS